MTKLKLDYPTFPFFITQAWGISNPSYLQFGFSKHNGVDFLLGTDKIAKAMCAGVVIETGFNTGAGNFVKYRTGLVEAEGTECLVEFYYMHAEKVLVQAGQIVSAGTPLIIQDNTGFSTGPHTHISAYRLNPTDWTRLDSALDTNRTFDWLKYTQYKFTRDMVKGENSTEVYQLQKRLGVILTGYYGSLTQQAVYNYQLANVPMSWYEKYILKGSRVGEKTRTKLNEI